MSETRLLRIALTPGEPAGIGPDLTLSLASPPADVELCILASRDLLEARAALLGAPLNLAAGVVKTGLPARVRVIEVPGCRNTRPGVPDPANAPYVLACLDRSMDGLAAGEFDAMVTGPVQKSAINAAGIAFTGYTEYLAERAGSGAPVMLLVAGELRVALATTHLPLKDVSATLTAASLEHTLRCLHTTLKAEFGLVAPRIAVCGLNPHAGEGGYLGREEIEVIAPVIERLRREGLNLEGPVSADTAFTAARRASVDAYLSMFHDQGLPVLKAMGFGHAVNVTLGLPFIRTSVDHGTALELAGSGRADAGSLTAAVDLATKMARLRRGGNA